MRKQVKTLIVAAACIFMLPTMVFAQLPANTYGWNIGNTMEPPSGEGTWNCPPVTQELIDAVAAAGFNTIRIPVAWDSHADADMIIDPAWMARVQEVVDYCYVHGLYVIVNSHWDDGWLDENIKVKVAPAIDAKVNAYWAQIANHFINYDNHLLFAGTNEPVVDRANQIATLLTYEQTFVDAVRATGGNNASRWLVVQGPSTDIDKTDEMMNALPNDPSGRLMVEVHYYSPYNFTMMTEDEYWGSQFYFWGQGYHSTTLPEHNPTWGEEEYLLEQFQKMKVKFVDQGVPVLVGEFGAIKRTENTELVGTADFDLHVAARTHFFKTIVDTANNMGLKPVYWDNGWAGADGWALFDRDNAALIDPDAAAALTGGPALPPPDGGPYCGDGTCNADEDCITCESDCGVCPPSYCGDGTCDPYESCNTCEIDCGTCCGEKGATCIDNSECCTNICRPAGRCG